MLHDTLTRSHTPIFVLFFFLLVCFFFFFFCVDGAGTKKETHLIIRVTEPPRRLPAKVLASFHVQRFFFFSSVSASLPFCHILLSFDQFLRVFFFLAYRSVHFRPDSCVHLCKRALSRTLRTLIFCLLFLLVYCSASPSGEIDSDFFVSLSFFFPLLFGLRSLFLWCSTTTTTTKKKDIVSIIYRHLLAPPVFFF